MTKHVRRDARGNILNEGSISFFEKMHMLNPKDEQQYVMQSSMRPEVGDFIRDKTGKEARIDWICEHNGAFLFTLMG